MLEKIFLLAIGVACVYGSNVDSAIEWCQHNGTTECTCDFGWTGPRCASPIDFCNHTKIISNGVPKIVSVCGEFGSCTNSPNGAVCHCDPGWTGPYCQKNINACDPNPCANGGTCVDLQGPGFQCVCTKWHKGHTCTDLIDLCHNLNIFHSDQKSPLNIQPCGDHGNCTMLSTGMQCSCDAGWTGTFCEHRIEYNCTHMGHSHPHGSTWKERCNTCQCHFGIVQCETGHWCPQRCLVYSTSHTAGLGIQVGCKALNENCVPDNKECARENNPCDKPTGWCFPVGYVMLQQPPTAMSAH